MDLLLGIDIGTTGTKCIAADTEGSIIASAYKGYKLYNDGPGRVEQDAGDWWEAVVYTVRECVRKTGADNIKAVALSSQAGSMLPVDEAGVPLRRAISWMDTRGEKQREELNCGKPEGYYYNLTGFNLSDGGNLIQIKWLRDHEPGIFEKTCKFLSTIDYVNYKLTGNYVIDVTSAAMTQLLDINNKCWDKGILLDLGIDEKRLPGITDSGEMIGCLERDAAERLGLSEATWVVSGGHDQYCAALGSGAINDGDAILSTGTAWVVLCISGKPWQDAESNFYRGRHVANGKWGLLASIESGGVCMEWLRNNLLSSAGGNNESCKEDFSTIDEMASERCPGSDGLMFYPHFTGVECPNWAPKNKGTFLGIDLSHDRYHFARAIMEGVGYEIKWMLEAMGNKGININSLKMLGGAAGSSVWPGIVADITGIPVKISGVKDMACIGGVILAGKGAGLFATFEEGCRKLTKTEKELLPDHRNTAVYKKRYGKYKKGFEFLKQIYLMDEE